jgi:hypothetical protein
MTARIWSMRAVFISQGALYRTKSFGVNAPLLIQIGCQIRLLQCL